VDRARAVAPEDASARDLERILRAAVRPDAGTSFTGAGDSDHETFYYQDLWIAGPIAGDARGTLTAGWRRATDDSHADPNTSYGVSGLLTVPVTPRLGARAGLGVRQLQSDSGNHTPVAAQVGMSWQPAGFAALGLGYSRASFDETATLIVHGFTTQNVDFSFDLDPKPTLSISGGAGATWFSDSGNRRLSGVLAVLAGLGHGVSAGVYGRMMGYRVAGHGYFAPGRFSVAEARVIYNLRRGHWGLRTDGGLGGQQIIPIGFSTGAWPSEWHLTAVLSHSWNGGEVTLEGLLTNSAGASTVGAFRYHSLTLGFHQGL
jgi:hypothetical protein